MDNGLSLEAARHPIIKPGDTVSLPVMIKRRWWQLWKPKWRTERRTYRITGDVTA